MPQRSPLHEVTTRAGAVFATDADWQMPAHFGDPAAEYRQTHDHAGLFDVSHRGKIEMTGKDACKFLHNLSTNNINDLAAGSGCEAFLTTGQARIVGHVFVFRIAIGAGPDQLLLDAAPGQAERLVKHLDFYHITEDVELTDCTTAFAQLHVAGPQAGAVLRQVFGDQVTELKSLEQRSLTTANGIPVQLRRLDRLGLPGHDLLVQRTQAESLWDALIAGGARPAGLQCHEVLRVEAGMPVYGQDIDETNLPQETGRTDQAISFTKGCYIGQETVARIRTYGHVNRSLVGLRLAGNDLAAKGSKLMRDGKEVGQVTSSVVSPRLGTALALAYVRRGNESAGTTLELAGEALPRTAEVLSLPL